MKNFDEVQEMAEKCLNCPTKPCTKGCPLGNDIPGFIHCIRENRYEDAYRILCKTTVMPSICGRICPHEKQCQGSCVRGIKGEPVSIGELEAFIGDMAIEENWNIADNAGADISSNDDDKFLAEKNTEQVINKKVAIVGSGPAGLTCAVFLAQKGIEVTIYEKHGKLGGLLRHGIPDFRLSDDVLDMQIRKILDLGIKVIYNKELGKDLILDELRQNYDAVFLAFGANISNKMNIPGENLNGVIGGNELLENGVFPNYKGKKVAVIGGGNVAMDVSRTIIRLGAERVYVIYRRAEEQMPAERKEIEDAKQEGIEFLFKTNLVRVNGTNAEEMKNDNGFKNDNISMSVFVKDSNVTSIECVKTELVKKEGETRLVPVDIEGSNYTLDMDYVVMAVGAKAERKVLDGLGVKLNDWGYIDVDDNYMTSIPNVFAGGDLAGNRPTVAWAARSGREAANAICKNLV